MIATVVVGIFGLVTLAPAGAFAAPVTKVSADGNVVTAVGQSGNNSITAEPANGRVAIFSSTDRILIGQGCSAVAPTAVICNADAATGTVKLFGRNGNDTLTFLAFTIESLGHLYVDGGSGSDTIKPYYSPQTLTGRETLYGGSGNDTIDGGNGSDTIRAGLGRDTVLAADGDSDQLDCGIGSDSFSADAFDSVIRCEKSL